MLELGRGAELAIFESTVLQYGSEHEAEGHLTAELAGKLAQEAGVKRLLLTHYPHDLGKDMLAAACTVFDGPVELARERSGYLL